MLFQNNNTKPRKKSYYPFSKNYPSKSGNIYAIGESRTKSIREKHNRIVFYCSLVALFAAVFVILSVSIALSRKPITNPDAGRAVEYEGRIRALYMPDDALDGGIAYSLFRNRLTNAKANAVMIDFKQPDGRLSYKTGYDKAAQIGADADASAQAITVISQLKNDGYKIIARIYCFEDTLAASMLLPAAVSDVDGSVWLDRSAQDDGNPWLNPYSESAQDYVLNIISESVLLGADMVVLDSVCFPDSPRIGKAVFSGEEGSTQSRNAVLHSFVSRAAELCADVPVAVYLSAAGALDGSEALYQGSMFDSDAVYNAVDFRPNPQAESQSGEAAVQDENSLIQSSVPLLKAKLEENYSTKGIIAVVDDEIYTDMLVNLGVNNCIIITAQTSGEETSS